MDSSRIICSYNQMKLNLSRNIGDKGEDFEAFKFVSSMIGGSSIRELNGAFDILKALEYNGKLSHREEDIELLYYLFSGIGMKLDNFKCNCLPIIERHKCVLKNPDPINKLRDGNIMITDKDMFDIADAMKIEDLKKLAMNRFGLSYVKIENITEHIMDNDVKMYIILQNWKSVAGVKGTSTIFPCTLSGLKMALRVENMNGIIDILKLGSF